MKTKDPTNSKNCFNSFDIAHLFDYIRCVLSVYTSYGEAYIPLMYPPSPPQTHTHSNIHIKALARATFISQHRSTFIYNFYGVPSIFMFINK